MALTTIEDVQSYSGTTAASGQIQIAIAWASAMIESYCDRSFASGSYTDTADGTGRQALLTRQYPIVSVASVEIDGSPVTDYSVYSARGILRRRCGWPKGYRNVVVEYTAGYEQIPLDMQMVATMLAVDLLTSTQFSGQMKSETIGKYSYTLRDDASMVLAYAGALAKYRRIA